MSLDQLNEFRFALEAAVASFDLDPLHEQQISQLVKHYAMLCRWNQRTNLTRIIKPHNAATFHYAESLFGARFISGDPDILDIGSGAGFPGVPIAIVRPDVQVTALEANHKKSLFLKEVKEELRLANFDIATTRLEQFKWRDYELLTSRALERADTVFQSVLEQMSATQRLMLYCAPDLIIKLESFAGRSLSVEAHAIPHSNARIIAIFLRASIP